MGKWGTQRIFNRGFLPIPGSDLRCEFRFRGGPGLSRIFRVYTIPEKVSNNISLIVVLHYLEHVVNLYPDKKAV